MDQLTKLNFEFNNTINAVTKKQYDVHLALYEGYVDKINEIWRELKKDPQSEKANATYSKYRGLKKEEPFALNGVILHELYFENLGGTNNTPSGVGLDIISSYFGTYENWKQDFIACGKASRGWAILCYDQRSKTLKNILCDRHDVGNVWNAYPIIIMDVYEHAYFVDYQNRKTEYIDRFMSDINWDVVNRRVQRILK